MSLPSVTPCAQIQTQVLLYLPVRVSPTSSSRANSIDSSASRNAITTTFVKDTRRSSVSRWILLAAHRLFNEDYQWWCAMMELFSKLPIRCLSSSTWNMPVLLPCSRRSLGGE